MISVIVPVYNVAPYLDKCLDSILTQTYKDLEILVIDDGSTDQSGEICDHYAKQDQRIRVFHTENHGLSAARNTGLDHMHGQYVGFVDSDDWIETNMYEQLIKLAEQTNADIVTCRFYLEYQNRTEVFSGPMEPFIVDGSDNILRTYLFQHGICQDSWNNLFKSELFQSIRYPEGRSFEDYYIKPYLLQKVHKMVYTPECLLHYRNRQNSLSNIHTLKSNIDYWWVIKERFELLGNISEEFYHLTLAQAIGSIGRMWQWKSTYSKEDKQEAKIYLDEMQQFNNMHFNEIMGGPAYSWKTKITSLLAKSTSPILFEVLYRVTQIYRKCRFNKKEYFS